MKCFKVMLLLLTCFEPSHKVRNVYTTIMFFYISIEALPLAFKTLIDLLFGALRHERRSLFQSLLNVTYPS